MTRATGTRTGFRMDSRRSTPDAGLVAIDWGTTSRRIHILTRDGTVLTSTHDDRGASTFASAEYDGEFAAIRQRHGRLPIVAAGMIGSTLGWREVPYVAAPAGIAELAAAALRCPDDILLVPGVRRVDSDRADVMRGEEVQALGAVAAGLAPGSALFCQPGTHAKWIEVVSGRIARFATAMTGELFALLGRHGTLAAMIGGPVADGPAFRRGVARGAGCGDLLDALFGVRAGVLLGTLAREDAPAYASGLLIGADVGARDLAGSPVHLLANGTLATLYAAAIAALGGTAIRIDSDAAFVAGIHALWETIE